MQKNISLMLGVVLLGISVSSFSVTRGNAEAQLAQLEAQVKSMQVEINELKHELRQEKAQARENHKKVLSQNLQVTKIKRQPEEFEPVSSYVVTTSVPDDKAGSALLVNTPSINRDVAILTRQQEVKAISRLILGGELDAKAVYTHPYTGSSDTDLDLYTAKLIALAKATPWSNGFLSIKYDNDVGNTPRRISNSNILLDEGFITFGNFQKSPFYSSIGQLKAPFGRFDTNMISDPLTYYLGNTKARALVLGYAPQSKTSNSILPYVSAYIFKGDAKVGNRNQYGVDGGFHFAQNQTKGEVGASYIADIADSEGFQNTYIYDATKFEGFDKSNSEKLKHHVPAVSVHGEIYHGPVSLMGEYVGVTKGFNQQDFSYNNHGARPKAFNAEGAYSFKIFQHASSFALGYSRSYEALGLNIPKHRYLATLSMNFLKHLLAQLEFDHDINYGKNDVAMGNTSSGMMPAYRAKDLGKTNNGITAKVNFYF